MKKYVLFIFALFLIPTFTHAAVSITEVAWMGVEGTNGQYGEWIELYNDEDQPMNLFGWKINKAGDKPIISLSKEIPAKGYFLVERVTGSIHDPVPGIEDVSGPFGSSGLSNAGEDLVLIDDKRNEVQHLSFASKWPAGDADTKQTMQWNGTEWITATATPKAATSQAVIDEPKTEEKDVENEQTGDTTEGTSTGDTKSQDKKEVIPASPNKPYIKFTIPEAVYSGIENMYEIQPILEYNYQLKHGYFTWNFGDGTVVQKRELEPVSHSYQFPGTYTVSFSYKEDKEVYGLYLIDSRKIEVSKPSLVVSVVDNRALQIENKSSTAINLSNFQVSAMSVASIVPDMTILAPKAKITIPFNSLSIPIGSAYVAISDPSGNLIARTD